MALRPSYKGDIYCKWCVIMFGLWLFECFTPTLRDSPLWVYSDGPFAGSAFDVGLITTDHALFIYIEKVRSYIARYPVRGTAQSTLPFTPWQTCSFHGHLNFSGKHSATLQLRRLFVHISTTVCIARYSFIQLSELCQRFEATAVGFETGLSSNRNAIAPHIID